MFPVLSGNNDVSWNNPSAKTPALGRLAKSGVTLSNAYTLPVCSPSRAAIMTGVYPFRMGLQVMSLVFHPFCLSILTPCTNNAFFREDLESLFQRESPQRDPYCLSI